MDGLAARRQPAETRLIGGERKGASDDIQTKIGVERSGDGRRLAGNIAGSTRVAARKTVLVDDSGVRRSDDDSADRSGIARTEGRPVEVFGTPDAAVVDE